MTQLPSKFKNKMMVVRVDENPAPDGENSPLDDEYVSADDEHVDNEDKETDSIGDYENPSGAPQLKKGPWSPEEDKRLKDYVEVHGAGNWNKVQKNAMLNRCGKSCRLRWTNHLRPDLKKDPFDAEEEEKIIKLYIRWGPKWSMMASYLPGRTDNEIKNFWNTRKRRKQRCGSPLHPEYMLSQLSHKDMDCETPGESHGKKRSNECSKEKVVDVQELVDELIVFEHLDYGKDTVFPTRPLKCHASTSSVQIPGAIEKTFCPTDLNYVMTKNQSVHVGSAIGSGYPVYGGRLSTSGTIFGSIQTEIPSIQSSSYSPSNDWLAQCPSACIEQRIPMECNTISQSKAYLMMHSSSAFCAPEHEACSETQAPDLCSGSDAVFDPSQCYPVASFSDLGISDTLLTKGLLNDIALASLLNVNLKDQSHINRQEPTNDTSLGGASFLNANLKDQSHLNWQEHMNETSPVAGLLNANLEEQSHLNWQEPKNESSPEAGFLNANLEEQSHLNWPLQEREPWTDGDKCFDQWFDPQVSEQQFPLLYNQGQSETLGSTGVLPMYAKYKDSPYLRNPWKHGSTIGGTQAEMDSK